MITRILTVVLCSLALCALPAPSSAGPVVLFDEGHAQQFLAGRAGDLDLSTLAAVFEKAGLAVRTTSRPLDAVALRGVSALVISGAFAPLAPAELESIRAFLSAGGRLAVMLHIGPPVQELLDRLGISRSLGPIHEAENLIGGRPTDFTVVRFERHALTEGLRQLSTFGCWGLRTIDPKARIIARTGAKAFIDSNGDQRQTPGEPVESAGVMVAGAVGFGSYVVFGDDAIFQNRFLARHNGELARRLAAWLAAPPAVPERPARPGRTAP